jgi:hypothetical protein
MNTPGAPASLGLAALQPARGHLKLLVHGLMLNWYTDDVDRLTLPCIRKKLEQRFAIKA